MDGAQANHRCRAVVATRRQQRVGGRGGCEEIYRASLDRTDPSADLGGSSK